MLLGSSRPYHWLILEENGRKTDDDDDGRGLVPTSYMYFLCIRPSLFCYNTDYTMDPKISVIMRFHYRSSVLNYLFFNNLMVIVNW